MRRHQARPVMARRGAHHGRCLVFMSDLKNRLPTSSTEMTLRMGTRRFIRLTNGFSKKVENSGHAVSLHYLD